MSKADTFADPSLKSYVFGLLGELNNISNSFLVSGSATPFLGSSRTKIRNLYVKLHPDQFAGTFPYDAFLQESNPNPAVQWDIQQYKVGDPILFLDSDRFFPVIHNNMKGIIKGIEILDPGTHEERIQFDVEIPKAVDESDLRRINLELLECWESKGKSLVRFCVHKLKSADEDGDESTSFTVVPFQIAYAVSIHKAQQYKNTSTAVLRVINLSGGNYWGLPSSAGVASSIKELVERNLKTGHNNGIISTIRTALPDLSTTYSYFNLL